MKPKQSYLWTNESLILAIKAGGDKVDKAMAYMYKAYKGPLLAFYRFYVPNISIREDIYSESFLDFMIAVMCGKYDETKNIPPGNYLWSIYRNKMFSWLRTGMIAGQDMPDSGIIPLPSTEEDLDETLFFSAGMEGF